MKQSMLYTLCKNIARSELAQHSEYLPHSSQV